MVAAGNAITPSNLPPCNPPTIGSKEIYAEMQIIIIMKKKSVRLIIGFKVELSGGWRVEVGGWLRFRQGHCQATHLSIAATAIIIIVIIINIIIFLFTFTLTIITFQVFCLLDMILFLKKAVSLLTDMHHPRLPSRLHPVKSLFSLTTFTFYYFPPILPSVSLTKDSNEKPVC